MDKERLRLLIPAREIRSIVERIAAEVRADYAGKEPVLVGVLKGAFVFLADLVRSLDMPVEIDFIQSESYGRRDVPAKDVLITKDVGIDLRGRHVIVVEDIIDTGNTVETVLRHLKAKGPASLRLCALILRGTPKVKVDYSGKTVGRGFLVGYGLDFKERHRNLDAIYVIEKQGLR